MITEYVDVTADHDTVTLVLFTTADTDAGGRGIPTTTGVNVTTFDGALLPTAFTASTRYAYEVPPTKLLTRVDRYALVVVATVDQLAPLFVDCSTM